MSIARILANKGRNVVTAKPHLTLREAADVLTRNRIGAVVVCDDGDPVMGMLSERDIVRAVSSGGAEALKDPISRHMTVEVITATEDLPVEHAMSIMTESRVRHLPVLHDGGLVGVVSIGDVVKIRLELIETEHQALRDYIATA
jgi:CBS domain-containing protein